MVLCSSCDSVPVKFKNKNGRAHEPTHSLLDIWTLYEPTYSLLDIWTQLYWHQRCKLNSDHWQRVGKCGIKCTLNILIYCIGGQKEVDQIIKRYRKFRATKFLHSNRFILTTSAVVLKRTAQPLMARVDLPTSRAANQAAVAAPAAALRAVADLSEGNS
jgi:hypothetical protein